MVLSETEERDPDLVRQDALFDDIPDDQSRVVGAPVGGGGDVTKGMQAQGKWSGHGSILSSARVPQGGGRCSTGP